METFIGGVFFLVTIALIVVGVVVGGLTVIDFFFDIFNSKYHDFCIEKGYEENSAKEFGGIKRKGNLVSCCKYVSFLNDIVKKCDILEWEE